MRRILQRRTFLIAVVAVVTGVVAGSVPIGAPRDRTATVKTVKMRDDPLLGRTVKIDVTLDGGRQVVATSPTGVLPRPGSTIIVRETAPLVGAARFVWNGQVVDPPSPR